MGGADRVRVHPGVRVLAWRSGTDGDRGLGAVDQAAVFVTAVLPPTAVCQGHDLATEEAERRGLLLALPASIEVTMVEETGRNRDRAVGSIRRSLTVARSSRSC